MNERKGVRKMNFNEYQELSKRTMPKPKYVMSMVVRKSDLYDGMAKSNYAMGLAGESGEVVDLIKKEVHHGHQIEIEDVKKEIGDILHYAAGVATMYGFTLEDAAIANIDKLRTRYPDGFSKEASMARVDVNDC